MSAALAKFGAWLSGLLSVLVVKIHIVVVTILQLLIDSLINVAQWILTLFPAGSSMPSLPSTPVGSFFDLTIGCLNWVFPVSFLVEVVTWGVAAMLLYLVIAPLARWAKLLT